MQTAYSLMVIFSKLTDDEEEDLVEHLVPDEDETSNSELSSSNMFLFEFLNIPLVCFTSLIFRFVDKS